MRDKKAKNIARAEKIPGRIVWQGSYYTKIGKVICISAGIFIPYNNHYKFKVKSFYGYDEKEVLNGFAGLLNSKFHGSQFALAAHNGKEFDYPYLSRRMLINGISIYPCCWILPGEKPWEINLLDTMELWKFGDYKSYTSLPLLAAVFLELKHQKTTLTAQHGWQSFLGRKWPRTHCCILPERCGNHCSGVIKISLRRTDFRGKYFGFWVIYNSIFLYFLVYPMSKIRHCANIVLF